MKKALRKIAVSLLSLAMLFCMPFSDKAAAYYVVNDYFVASPHVEYVEAYRTVSTFSTDRHEGQTTFYAVDEQDDDMIGFISDYLFCSVFVILCDNIGGLDDTLGANMNTNTVYSDSDIYCSTSCYCPDAIDYGYGTTHFLGSPVAVMKEIVSDE